MVMLQNNYFTHLEIFQQNGKNCVKAVYCHPACLTYMQSASCKMPSWKKLELGSRLLGEISITSVRHIQLSLVAQSCPTLCDPMNHSTPGLPVHHQLPVFNQTHVYRVGIAIQSSHPLLPSSPPAFNLSQHQGVFQWVSSFPVGLHSFGSSGAMWTEWEWFMGRAFVQLPRPRTDHQLAWVGYSGWMVRVEDSGTVQVLSFPSRELSASSSGSIPGTMQIVPGCYVVPVPALWG